VETRLHDEYFHVRNDGILLVLLERERTDKGLSQVPAPLFILCQHRRLEAYVRYVEPGNRMVAGRRGRERDDNTFVQLLELSETLC
jgi:hypothetical protein